MSSTCRIGAPPAENFRPGEVPKVPENFRPGEVPKVPDRPLLRDQLWAAARVPSVGRATGPRRFPRSRDVPRTLPSLWKHWINSGSTGPRGRGQGQKRQLKQGFRPLFGGSGTPHGPPMGQTRESPRRARAGAQGLRAGGSGVGKHDRHDGPPYEPITGVHDCRDNGRDHDPGGNYAPAKARRVQAPAPGMASSPAPSQKAPCKVSSPGQK